MPETATSHLGQIHGLLATKRYSVTDLGDDVLKIEDVDSGVSLRAVLIGDIVYFSLVCMVAPASAITPQVMHKMLAADNGISTSYFQLHDAADKSVAITLNNFCKLQEMGPDDEDDILSCVHFLLADVLHARDLLGADLHAK